MLGCDRNGKPRPPYCERGWTGLVSPTHKCNGMGLTKYYSTLGAYNHLFNMSSLFVSRVRYFTTIITFGCKVNAIFFNLQML